MPKVSIIVVANDHNAKERQITGACFCNIEKHTNEEDYELIFIDQESYDGKRLDDVRNPGVIEYHSEVIDKYISLKENIGLSASFNLGAKESTGEYLCFMHNDVLVPDNWLLKLLSYVKDCVIVTPHQGPTTRQNFLKWSSMTHEEIENIDGNYDAGLLLMKKSDFLKTGGWDENFKSIFPGLVFVRFICGKYGIGLHATPEVIITHLGRRSDEEEPYRTLYSVESVLLHTRGYVQ